MHWEYRTPARYAEAMASPIPWFYTKANVCHHSDEIVPFNLVDTWRTGTMEERIDHVHVTTVYRMSRSFRGCMLRIITPSWGITSRGMATVIKY